MIDPHTLNLLRRYVDGELDAAEHAAFEARLAEEPALARAAEVEGRLREHVAAVLTASTPTAPTELHEHVHAAIAAAALDHAAGAATAGSTYSAEPIFEDEEEAVVAQINTSPARKGRFLAEPMRVDWRAAAAVILLITGAVLVGVFGTPLDQRGLGPAEQREALVADTVDFITSEHRRCAMNEGALVEKTEWTNRANAQHELARYLGVNRVILPDFSRKGYEFVGAGRCHVPGSRYSGHALYRRTIPGQPPAMLSLFLVPDQGADPLVSGEMPLLQEGEWKSFRCDDKGRGSCGDADDAEAGEGGRAVKTVPFSSDGAVMYLMACCDGGDLMEMCGACCSSWKDACSGGGD